MCDILKELKGIDARPVSKSFDNYEKIPSVLNKISQILAENNNVVISANNRQRIVQTIQILNKKVSYC
ncbi:MAG: hypothetical protein Q9M43_13360 [Sulfurimonas sp.]|nr:hypothetical protein [Sulfurimonas sp.]